MLRFKLSNTDTLAGFMTGLESLGRIDVVTRHENRFRDTMLLGQALAYAEIGGCMRPLVIHWQARVDIAADQRNNPLARDIEDAVKHWCGAFGGIVQRDIRTEARSIGSKNVKALVEEDIERGDLPNRMLFQRGLQQALYTQIGQIYRKVGHDPDFDWQQVRVMFDQA